MVAHWWPHDPKLGRAARVLGDEQALAAQALPELVASLTAGRGRLLAQQLALVQVVPELRACARVTLQIEPAAGRAPVMRTVYAKTDAEQRGAVTHAVMSALRRSPAAAKGLLSTPQPLLWQAELALHWQAELPGRVLLDVEPVLRPDTSARVGAMLAALHATPVPAARRCGFDALRERIAAVVQTLTLVSGDELGPLDALATRLTAGLSHLRGLPNLTLHGDLHPRNLLVHEDRLGLIDLDSVRHGPALLELGDWVADALYRALLAGTPAATVLPACRAFVVAYAQASGWHPAEPALAWSVAHSLVHAARLALRGQPQARSLCAGACAARAGRCAAARGHPRRRGAAAAASRLMPNPDLSRLLLDAPRIGAQLCEQIPAWRGLDPAWLVVHQSRRRISRKTEEAGAPYLGVAYGWTDAAPQAPWLYLRAHTRGTSAAAAAGSGASHLAELDAVAWLLPDEPALDALSRFLDTDTVAALLPGAGEGRAGLAQRGARPHRALRARIALHGALRHRSRRRDPGGLRQVPCRRSLAGQCGIADGAVALRAGPSRRFRGRASARRSRRAAGAVAAGRRGPDAARGAGRTRGAAVARARRRRPAAAAVDPCAVAGPARRRHAVRTHHQAGPQAAAGRALAAARSCNRCWPSWPGCRPTACW